MRADEVRALGHLGGQLVAEVTGWAEQMHGAVASRTFRWLGLAPCEGTVLPATNHFALLKDRRVADALVGWLA